MKYKKLIALLLCCSFLLVFTAACNSPEEDNPYNYENGDGDDNPDIISDDHHHDHAWIDFNAAITSFSPDTIMIKSGNVNITWDELYIFLFHTVMNLTQSFGGEFDWLEEFEPNSNLAEVALEFSTEDAISFLTFKHGIDKLNVELSPDELVQFNNDLNDAVEMFGGLEALEETVQNSRGYYNFDTFSRLYKMELLIDKLFEELYGDDAVDFPDEKISGFAEEHGFMMAMHILRLKTEDESADPLAEAEEILDELNKKLGSDDFEEFFKELMNEKSEDYGGLMSYPTGYLFVKEDMVPEFSAATAALEIGQISDIVETTYGYHIILRLPIDYDIIPSGLSREGITRTLRQVAAVGDFNNVQREWFEALNITFTPEYESINLAEIFNWQEEDCDE